jgi:Protein of unknown function (DUF2586)
VVRNKTAIAALFSIKVSIPIKNTKPTNWVGFIKKLSIMGSLKGVDISKGIVGADVSAPTTSTSALMVIGAVVVAAKFALNTSYVVTSLKDAETRLGITPAYDLANNLVFHRHIKDFYSDKRNRNVKLYLLGVALGSVPATVIEDTAGVASRRLLIAGNKAIKQLAFALNLATGDTETKVDGLNSLIRAAIAKAQVLYDWADSTDRPCNMLLEGRGIATDLTTLLDLRNIPVGDDVLNATNVSVVIGQDYDYAASRTAGADVLCKKYAGVGKALGTVAAAEVNQSIAEVDEVTGGFNLSDATNALWVTAGLSNFTKVNDQDDYLVAIDAKGYIFPITHNGVSGLRWNADHTCTPIKVDEDGNINVHEIYFGRTLDLACLRLKTYLTKWVKKRVNVDPKTGKLPTAVVKQLEASSNKGVFAKMVNEGLISGGNTIINGDSNVQPPTSLLSAEFDIVPTAIIGEVSGTVYLKKSLSV